MSEHTCGDSASHTIHTEPARKLKQARAELAEQVLHALDTLSKTNFTHTPPWWATPDHVIGNVAGLSGRGPDLPAALIAAARSIGGKP